MTEDKQIIKEEIKRKVRPTNNRNVFRMKCIFDERGDNLENIIERAFGNYCSRKI